MTTEAGQAGTTSGAGGNAAETRTTGTTPEADRDAGGGADTQELETLRREREQWLAEKSNYERLKRESEESRTVKPPPTDDHAGAQIPPFWREVQENAAAGSPEAIALLQLGETMYGMVNKKTAELDAKIQRLDEPSEVRAEVDEAWKSGDFASRAGARRYIEEQRKTKALEARLAEIEQGGSGGTTRTEEPRRVGTYTRSVSAKEMGAKEEMEAAEYRRQVNPETSDLTDEERVELRRRKESKKLALKSD